MKIQVTGESAPAKALRNHLASLGYRLASEGDRGAEYAVHLEASECEGVTLSGTPGELADRARLMVEELAQGAVNWQETGARELRVAAGPGLADAAERGVLRALLQVTGHGVEKNWVRKYFGRRTR
jgi:hypothetical protein